MRHIIFIYKVLLISTEVRKKDQNKNRKEEKRKRKGKWKEEIRKIFSATYFYIKSIM